jgi:hypothetical protein
MRMIIPAGTYKVRLTGIDSSFEYLPFSTVCEAVLFALDVTPVAKLGNY